MSIDLPNIEKDYYVFTEYPEIIKKAKECGLDNFILFNNQKFDQDVLNSIKEKHKNVVHLYPTKDEKPAMGTPEQITSDSDLCIIKFNPWGKFILNDDDEEGTVISTIEEVSEHILYFVNFIEVRIKMTGISYKCGNCHTMFSENDKYCRVCGTERGKGSYLPYEDQSWVLYGAPIKKRYKCLSCGNIWISRQWDSNFCPKCGKETVKHINEHSFLIRYLFDFAGNKSPYDSDDHPSLLSENQVLRILRQRKPLDNHDYFDQRLPLDEISMIMNKAGIPIPETLEKNDVSPYDDKLSDQMNLVQILMFLDGNNPYSYHSAHCPHCKSKMAAGICYSIYAGKVQLDNMVHMPAKEDPLTYYDGRRAIDLTAEESVNGRPAYVCLQCGDFFGEFKLSKLKMWKYRNALNKAE